MTSPFSTALRRAFVPTSLSAALLLALAPQRASAQVGHLPDKSPYEDVKPGQTITLSAGRLGVKRDPANVAPDPGLFFGMRYDLPIGGPAGFFVRYEFAPSQRRLLDPAKPLATRVVGTPSVTTHVMDLGLDVSLTGRKTWHRLMPSLVTDW
jgi:hypothetical protein